MEWSGRSWGQRGGGAGVRASYGTVRTLDFVPGGGKSQEDSSRGLGAPAVWCFRRTPGCWTETRIETEMDWEAVAREIQG